MKKLVWLAGLTLIFLFVFGAVAGAEPSFVWPVRGEVITSFNVGDNQYEAGQHRGIDISAPVGDEVVAAAEGTVAYAARNPQGGYMITIDHPGGLSTTYLGLGEKEVGRGQAVSAGQPIGKIGSEGDSSSSSPHLHLGVYETATRSNKVYLNPLTYLPPVISEPEPASQPSVSPVAEGGAPDSPAVPEIASPSPEEIALTLPVFGEALESATLKPAEGLAPSATETIELLQPAESLPEMIEFTQPTQSPLEMVQPLQLTEASPQIIGFPQPTQPLATEQSLLAKEIVASATSVAKATERTSMAISKSSQLRLEKGQPSVHSQMAGRHLSRPQLSMKSKGEKKGLPKSSPLPRATKRSCLREGNNQRFPIWLAVLFGVLVVISIVGWRREQNIRPVLSLFR